MDDDWVTSITKSEVVTSAAYLLIYQRVHPIRMADPRDFISFNVERNEIKKGKVAKEATKVLSEMPPTPDWSVDYSTSTIPMIYLGNGLMKPRGIQAAIVHQVIQS